MRMTRFGIVVLLLVGLAVLARFGSVKMTPTQANTPQEILNTTK